MVSLLLQELRGPGRPLCSLGWGCGMYGHVTSRILDTTWFVWLQSGRDFVPLPSEVVVIIIFGRSRKVAYLKKTLRSAVAELCGGGGARRLGGCGWLQVSMSKYIPSIACKYEADIISKGNGLLFPRRCCRCCHWPEDDATARWQWGLHIVPGFCSVLIRIIWLEIISPF